MKYFITFLLILLYPVLFAQTLNQVTSYPEKSVQESGEVYFKFRITDQVPLEKLTRLISLDQFDDGICYAYANPQQFLEFKKLGIEFEILPNPGDLLKDPKMLDSIDIKGPLAWDFYPTYTAYVDMMYQFAANYPSLCQVFSIGTTVQGRQLLMAKISDNVAVREAEPQFLYTSSMHGDEVTGYILMLRLIDYLLVNYGTNAKVTNLVDNIEIWINPLANPDGTYIGGNASVSGARRGNGNNVDLNRNYPDPRAGQHPDGNVWQPETVAFMQLAASNHFVMSANFHGGVEVVNYPWDTWSKLTADNSWWVTRSRQYVDTVHLYSPSTYMTYLNNGITNGAAWYIITGGRQDYMNYFYHCREITMELSNTKLLAASLLPAHWQYNYRSLLNYMEQCLYGVRGIVTDSLSGLPLEAKVYISGFDMDESFVYSTPDKGNYHRFLAPGNYNLTFSLPSGIFKTIQGVSVVQNQTTTVNVQLYAGPLAAEFQASSTSITTGKKINFTNNSTGNPVSFRWLFEGGTPSISTEKNPLDIAYMKPGTYAVQLKIFNFQGDSTIMTKVSYITVSSDYLMMNGTFDINTGTFYDSGGAIANYSNSEDYSITFLPNFSQAKVEVSFVSFDIQSSTNCASDYLSIYNGASTASTLIGKYCGTTSPGTVVASNTAGALTFVFHSNASNNRPGWKATISCRATQILTLSAGWSGLSSFVQPINADPAVMFSSIIDKIVIIQGKNGVYWPAQNINTLGNWTSEQGYQLKLQDNCQLNIIGYLPGSEKITLQSGWNIVPVKSDIPISVSALGGLYGAKILFIKEIAGTLIYWPEMGISTLDYFVPGKSYYLKASQGFELDFDLLR